MHQVQKRNTGEYVCDCVSFHQSGYLCSHVLAAMHCDEKIDIANLVKTLQPARRQGKPSARSSALTKDDTSNVDITSMMRKPRQYLYAHVMLDGKIGVVVSKCKSYATHAPCD